MTQHSEQWRVDSNTKRSQVAMSVKRQRQKDDAPKAPSELSHGVTPWDAQTKETLALWGEQIKQQAAEKAAQRAEQAAEKARQAQEQAEARPDPDEERARMIRLYKGLFK
jgi:hypothetical protein